jgi:hypothetical protein
MPNHLSAEDLARFRARLGPLNGDIVSERMVAKSGDGCEAIKMMGASCRRYIPEQGSRGADFGQNINHSQGFRVVCARFGTGRDIDVIGRRKRDIGIGDQTQR